MIGGGRLGQLLRTRGALHALADAPLPLGGAELGARLSCRRSSLTSGSRDVGSAVGREWPSGADLGRMAGGSNGSPLPSAGAIEPGWPGVQVADRYAQRVLPRHGELRVIFAPLVRRVARDPGVDAGQ